MVDDRVVSQDSWEDWRELDEPIVFVVGAGFSRAVSDQMPLTDELGEAALERLRSVLPPRLALERLPKGMNFEAWLSQLAGDQPYLSDAENAENRAAFLRFSEEIARLSARESRRCLPTPIRSGSRICQRRTPDAGDRDHLQLRHLDRVHGGDTHGHLGQSEESANYGRGLHGPSSPVTCRRRLRVPCAGG